MLCEVAFACDLASVDCIMTAEMIHTLAILLESAAQHNYQTHCPSKELGFTICCVFSRTADITGCIFCTWSGFMEYHSGV